MDVQALMSKKVGGIPVVYIAAVVMAAALYAAIKMPRSAEPVEDIEGDTEDVSGDGLDTDQPVFSATPVIYQPSGGPSVSSTPQEDTNELWGRRSVEWLTANGFTLTMASTAITKYLSGETLSYNEGQARDKAVGHFGLPPEGLIPTSTAAVPTAPASKQGTPPCNHTVRGTRDNNTAELARIYYGIANADAVNLIDSKNPTVPKPYRVGAVIRIPAFHEPKYYVATSACRTLYAIARKNGTTPQAVKELNPSKTFPVKVGVRVRVR